MLAVVLLGASSAAAAGPPPTDDRPLPTIGGRSSVSRVEPRFSQVASALAGKPVEVRCWSRLDDEWRAWTDGRVSLLGLLAYYRKSNLSVLHASPRLCQPLVPFVYAKARPKNSTRAKADLAVALLSLAHETQHLIGHAEENVAECYGLQRIRPLARMLGASRDYAAGLARLAWKVYLSAPPDSYYSPECRDGGALDKNPATAIWP